MKYESILQIDDDLDDCEFFKEALESVSNASYVSITDPLEVIDELQNCKPFPDLIILDINMPKMDGPILLQSLRNNDDTRNIPVIIFSTSPYSDKDITDSLNVLDYIVKPNSFQELCSTIKQILEV